MKLNGVKHLSTRSLLSRKVVSMVLSFVLLTTSSILDFGCKQDYIVNAASNTIEDFGLKNITMTDSYCTNAFDKEVDYLLSFNTDKLLAGFRDNAGLSMNNATRYGGWEGSLIGGHCVGHYLSSIAQAYNNPNLTSTEKQQFYTKITTLVDGLLKCQQNSKGKTGFIWAAQIIDKSNVEIQFDNIENSKTNIITEAWVPWYTMHKLIAGLIDVYNLTGYQNAKMVASGLGDWVYNRSIGWSTTTLNKVLSVEYGGMNDCMYELYKITGKETHAIAAHRFDDTALFERVLTGGSNVLNNLHANTTIPKFIGALKRYTILNGKTISGKSVDSNSYLKYAEAFWNMVVNRHTYITGGNSEWEHFGEDYKLDSERTNCNCETCNVYNMLKLTRELFKITGDSKYMEYYETTYYNSILSSQNPETGMTTYFQPMATGYFKVFSSSFNNFWCCTGSGMENFTKLGDSIYMHSGNALYVNLYQSSKLNWVEKNVTIIQNSTIPDGDTSSFTISSSSSATLDLRFRIPDWTAGTVTIKLNGQQCNYNIVSGYAQISGTFNNGDVITLTIPEKVVAYSLPDSDKSYAFKYGPVVLSAELGTTDMTQTTTGMNVSIPAKQIVNSQNININSGNGSVASFMTNINKYMVKDSNLLSFTLTGTNTTLKFTPHYRQYKQRYGIYWCFSGSGDSTDENIARAETQIVDTVQPGYGQYESDDLHAMTDINSVGVTSDGTYRYAKAGGSFSYRMALDKNAYYKILVVKFRKEDNGKTIKIKIGDTVLYAKTLNYLGTSSSYSVKIIIPDSVISKSVQAVLANGKNYDVVKVTFSSNNSSDSARICDFIYMTSVNPLYSIDNGNAYFIDCGDHGTTTATTGDKFGYFNSLTEQTYGEDTVTGYSWGIIDDTNDQYGGSTISKAVYTANTWPNEYSTSDGQNKTSSYRYTKNQYENGIARHLDYGFELPNGTYTVEIGLSNPWNCSNNPTIYANYGTSAQSTVASSVTVSGNTVVTGTVRATNGKLTLNFLTNDKAINVTYIIIKFGTLDELPTENDIVVPTVAPTVTPIVTPTVVPTVKPTTTPVNGAVPVVTVTSTTSGSVSQNYIIKSSNVAQPIDLSKVTLRYYYDKTGTKDQTFTCDSAGLSLNVSPYYENYANGVKGTFYNGYLEISFSDAYSLADGSLSLGIRFYQSDWSSYENFTAKKLDVLYNGVVISTQIY